MRKIIVIASLVLSAFLNGCATVPMASVESDKERKEFSPPSHGTAGLYIYRNSALGSALKKSVYIDGQLVGETAPMTYFYKEVQPGPRVISTESEFSNNDITLDVKLGRNYFVKQYIKIGLFVGGANLEIVSEEEGQKGVLQCKLANTVDNDSFRSNSIGSVSVIEFYGEAEEEVNTDSYNKDLWAKALVDVEGDETKRKVRYIELRANQLYSEKVGAVSGTSSDEQSAIVTESAIGYLSGNYRSKLTGNYMEKFAFRIEHDGNKIKGISQNKEWEIEGVLEENSIKFKWWSSGNKGKGKFAVDPSGNMAGTYQGDSWGEGKWNLTRIE